MDQNPNTNITQTAHIANSSAYNPYNGREALDLIMKRLYRQLCDHQDFGAHLAYTEFGMEFTLRFKGEVLDMTVVKGKEVWTRRDVDKTHTVTGISPKAPDDGRAEAGLPIPKPQLTDSGLVDFTLDQQPIQGVNQ